MLAIRKEEYYVYHCDFCEFPRVSCDLVRVDRPPQKSGVMWTYLNGSKPRLHLILISLKGNGHLSIEGLRFDGETVFLPKLEVIREIISGEIWVVVPRGMTVEGFYGEDW